MSEQFYISQPRQTGSTKQGPNGPLPVYHADGIPVDMMWSGKMSLPQLGDRVRLTINSIGWGKVEGYCVSHGYLGLLVRPENPPAWYVKQTRQRVDETAQARRLGKENAAIERVREWPAWVCEGIACVFGAEVSLEEAPPKAS